MANPSLSLIALWAQRAVYNKLFVSSDEAIVYSGDVGFIQFVYSLTSTLQEPCSKFHTFLTRGEFIELPKC
jgi:hypothetical protein